MSFPATAELLVRRRLRTLWTRRLAATLLDRACAALLVVAAAVLVAGVYRLLRGEVPVTVELARNLCGAALCGVGIYTLGSAPTLEDLTGWIDRRAGTHDRFHTALAFAARPALTPLEETALAECGRYIERFPVRRWTPIRVPRTLPFVVVPLVSLGLLAWYAALGIGQGPRDPALDAAVAERAAALAKMADRLHREEQQRPAPDLSKLAEAMKRSAEKLKGSARQGDEQKLKSALGELSSLEAMLAAMKQAAQDEKISPGELAALAAALAANESSKGAGESVKQGQLEQAGDQLEKLAEQMKAQGGGAEALQQLAQSMQEQAAKLSEQEKNEVARQMQEAAQSAQNGQEQLSAKAMQRLAELLRKAGKSGAGQRQASSQPGGSGGPMSEQQMQDLLNALENMKEGLQPGDGGQNPGSPGDGQPGAQSLALVESFANKGGGEPQAGEKPSGLPGSEHDSGTNDHLLADRPPDAPKPEGSARRLEGVLGDGASLQELVGATAGPARASRGYRNLYEAIAPAEQNSVEQENIPLGSRFFVRRYFENIRPQN